MEEGDRRKRRDARKAKKMRYERSDFELSAKQRAKGFFFAEKYFIL